MAPESSSGRRGRILIVDDSAVMRGLLRSVLVNAGYEVAGTAVDGESALDAVGNLKPDLVLMDVEMPVKDGVVTLRNMRARGHRMPVIMCSSLTQRGGQVTIEALAAGASDYVAKPQNQPTREAATEALTRDLIPKLQALIQPSRIAPPPMAGAIPVALNWPPPAALQGLKTQPPHSGNFSLLAIGSSTGGPAALDNLLPALPADFPLPILIVQHMPEVFTQLLAERLSSHCKLRVREAGEGDAVRAGMIYIARGDWHLEALPAARGTGPATLHLTQGPHENHCRPAADVLFRSVASVYGAGVLALVLTGMGCDGLAGCRVVRDRGGYIVAQDQATSIVWGMPGAVAGAGLAHRILPLNQIAAELTRLAEKTQLEATPLRETAVRA